MIKMLDASIDKTFATERKKRNVVLAHKKGVKKKY